MTVSQPVFDAHVRLRPRPDAAAELLSTMDSVGIARAAVAAGGMVDLDRLSTQIVDGGHVATSADNGSVLAGCAASGGRLVPVYFANPHAPARAYQRAAPAFRGVEISPAVHGVGFDDPRTSALVRVAASVGHSVYTVCVPARGARTTDLIGLARRFPDVTFVFGHCGFIGVDAAGIAAIEPYPNIVAETSGCFSVIANLAVRRLGADRVLFGSEYPLQHPTVELAKYAALELSPAAWRQVAWANAHRLFGEEPR
jgi:uncharacterized protein